LVKLLGYDFSIEYKKRLENSAADGLSQIDHEAPTALSLLIPHCVGPIKEEVLQEEKLQNMVRSIQQDTVVGPWSFKSELIFYQDRSYLFTHSISADNSDNPRVP
jgi:hypothetical protein